MQAAAETERAVSSSAARLVYPPAKATATVPAPTLNIELDADSLAFFSDPGRKD